MTQEKTLFVRAASGLVREMSTLSSSVYNVACALGGSAGNQIATPAVLPAFVIFGVTSYSLGMGIATVAFIPFCLIYFALVACMPRTGGDYTFTTRITSPILGWIEAWTLVFACLALVGYVLWLSGLAVASTFLTFWVTTGDQVWFAASQLVVSKTGLVAIGLIILVFIFVQNFISSGTYYRIFGYVGLVSAVLTCLMIVPLFAGDAASYASGFERFTGMSPSSVIALAQENGMMIGTFEWMSLITIVSMAVFTYIGFQYSIYLAGELKGNVKRNAMISVFVGLLAAALVNVVLVNVVLVRYGYELNMAWSSLFWFAPQSAPFGGAQPWMMLMTAMARPDLGILSSLASVGTLILLVLLGSGWTVLVSRIIFAWSMDRVVPKWFAEVNARTNSPLRLMVLSSVGVFVYFILALFGANPSSLFWYIILLAAPSVIMPGFNAILLPKRRPDLYELAPSSVRRTILGVPAISILGAIWLVFIVVVYGVAFVWPVLNAGVSSAAEWVVYSTSTGIVHVIVIAIVGIAIWVASREYNKRKGIDVDAIFRTVPPE